jgi:LmbE family N-acetylglucosaminyl deacetylase
MDDEVFGCGGTLARAAAAGSTVHVVFLTDGSRGYDPDRVADLSESRLREFRRTLTETRKAEARQAGTILGFAEPVFLDLPDGSAGDALGATERLAHAIRNLAPDTVFLPFPADPHPDHWAANRLFVDIVDVSGILRSEPCWAYEVWNPLVANTLVDVTDVMARKQDAMAVYRSQNLDVDYPRVIASLNAYRSLAAGLSRGYVEAYFVETVAEYCSIFKKFSPGPGR